MKIEQQNQILGCMNDVLNQNGFRAEIMQKDGAPTILRCEAMRQGKVAKDVVIEACFIPMQLPAEDMGLLQFFSTTHWWTALSNSRKSFRLWRITFPC